MTTQAEVELLKQQIAVLHDALSELANGTELQTSGGGVGPQHGGFPAVREILKEYPAADGRLFEPT
jgi:hypothetical protein